MLHAAGCSDQRERTLVWQWSGGFIRKRMRFNTGYWTSSGLFLTHLLSSVSLAILASCLFSSCCLFWGIWSVGHTELVALWYIFWWSEVFNYTRRRWCLQLWFPPLCRPAVTHSSYTSLCVMSLIDLERVAILKVWHLEVRNGLAAAVFIFLFNLSDRK